MIPSSTSYYRVNTCQIDRVLLSAPICLAIPANLAHKHAFFGIAKGRNVPAQGKVDARSVVKFRSLDENAIFDKGSQH